MIVNEHLKTTLQVVGRNTIFGEAVQGESLTAQWDEPLLHGILVKTKTPWLDVDRNQGDVSLELLWLPCEDWRGQKLDGSGGALRV